MKQLPDDEFAYYHPCGNVEYMHNKTKAAEWGNDFNRSDFWPSHVVCKHVKKNLSLPKQAISSSEKSACVSSFFRPQPTSVRDDKTNSNDCRPVSKKRKAEQITPPQDLSSHTP